MNTAIGGRRALARLCVLVLVLTVFLAPSPTRGAQKAADDDTIRASATIEAAIVALGGPKYLAVKSASAVGVYTPFNQGQPTVPTQFADVFVYPDKNRTDFGKKKYKVVQSNTGDSGWKFDGARELLVAQTEEEIRLFQRFIRANIDNVLRSEWREQGVQLRYVGRKEIAPRVWAEQVTVTLPEGLEIELLFDPQSHLPVLSRYREGAESGAPGSMLETRYYTYLDFGGVKVPRTVDLFRDQVQTARLVYEKVAFNEAVPENFFTLPGSAKELK